MTSIPGRDELRVDVACEDGNGVVVLGGEFDHHGVPTLTDAISQLVGERVSSVRIVAADVTFIDSAGLSTLLNTRRELHDLGISFQLGPMSAAVDRVIDLSGLRDVLTTTDPDS